MRVRSVHGLFEITFSPFVARGGNISVTIDLASSTGVPSRQGPLPVQIEAGNPFVIQVGSKITKRHEATLGHADAHSIILTCSPSWKPPRGSISRYYPGTISVNVPSIGDTCTASVLLVREWHEVAFDAITGGSRLLNAVKAVPIGALVSAPVLALFGATTLSLLTLAAGLISLCGVACAYAAIILREHRHIMNSVPHE